MFHSKNTPSASSNQRNNQSNPCESPAPMERHVYLLETDEPLGQQFEADYAGGIGCAYSTRKKAETAMKEYCDEYGPDSAKVISIPLL